MPVAICGRCGHPSPDSFYDHETICTCKTTEEWKEEAERNKWMMKIKGILYDYTGPILKLTTDYQHVPCSLPNKLTREELYKYLDTIKEEL